MSCIPLEVGRRFSDSFRFIEARDTEALENFLEKHRQGLLPMVEMIELLQVVAAEKIDVLGRVMIEVVLRLSAEQIAGPPHLGKKAEAMGGK